jgi:hypothetical protein
VDLLKRMKWRIQTLVFLVLGGLLDKKVSWLPYGSHYVRAFVFEF